jgi:hypothetical protein
MANLSFLKRLIKEDFDKKYQELVGKIAFVLNPALAQITNILNHGLLISDLNTQVKDLEITVDSDGVPTTDASFKSGLKGKCGMIQVGRAQATTETGVFPTGGHSVSFVENNGQIIISHITGLPANTRFTVRVIAYV